VGVEEEVRGGGEEKSETDMGGGRGAIDLGTHCCCVADLGAFSQLGLGAAILGVCTRTPACPRVRLHPPARVCVSGTHVKDEGRLTTIPPSILVRTRGMSCTV